MRKEKTVHFELKEHLMGHMGKNLSQSYANNLQDINWVFEEWMKLQTLICVDCITVDNTSKLVNEHKKQIADLELVNDNLHKEMAEMRAEMKEAHESIKKLSNIIFDVRDGKITLKKE